tara:strand:+ start:398 stop:1393 length:996 start_codon:yes stop_codon:yes gene_type:complete
MIFDKYILITGGAGFIGSHLVEKFVINYENYFIINLDKLTYASDINSIKELEKKENYFFVHGDICDANLINHIFQKFPIDSIIHLAAESHVDNSIKNPLSFINTNILGTVNLLEASKKYWLDSTKKCLFYNISTDEVYGSLGKEGLFTENSLYSPNSPYSASKASADHFVRAYGKTYNLPFIISNCSNNYGPRQHSEKLIPMTIKNIQEKQKIPIYGKGDSIRDWIFVLDHIDAIDMIFHSGKMGETYNIGSNNEWVNLTLVQKICNLIDKKIGTKNSKDLISFVSDRPGHDMRYAIDSSKIMNQLNWTPKYSMQKGLELTIDWYFKKNSY